MPYFPVSSLGVGVLCLDGGLRWLGGHLKEKAFPRDLDIFSFFSLS